ncbi:transcriptional regulator MarR family [Thermoclostridium stercorarium subsp. stercorarium DSM 8532]|jgi:DNA-binding MarR family transcriptional regulator|uniref:Transcriptional regulator MarR family n=3 Tax=Thermoclostridium stercorarium TaxID=1510 RepID=L7VQ72_THES1|nr:MarR family winged helix-turn-helix transcriptional regulator [Thermoclostridium stercorarium]AGC68849.1 transcriptional regulator MarR family [Thermoclostridium stercorarium subsp. stercorarium DSM 8532]AGI39847.1 transcriptional regulator [Thermoclostridium stercorarium subsp. stercorarium DSM 8532]ANW99155.1 MarR family transcriptional regulator [Thermoclostridium stercorarium subsp. thermolacticum DSM 2910]ANX01717.1 MarR family transcriptional regulator [Thermoclostridium stercorarium s
MDIDSMAVELSQMHIDNAKLLTQIANALSMSGEMGVLLWLSQQKSRTYATDIIKHFGLTPGRVANILKKLEQRQLIVRHEDTVDQRKFCILLTKKGVMYANELYSQMNDGHARILAALGQEDASEGLRILKRVITLINNGVKLHTADS